MIPPKKESGGDFTPVAEGTHMARCYGMAHIGTLEETFNGDTKNRDTVVLFFEIPDELRDDGKPHTINNSYTYSMHEKSSLRAAIGNWRGKALTEAEAESFDISKLIGHPALCSVIHNKTGKYANIKSVAKLMKGQTCPAQINQTINFDINDFDKSEFEKLPKYWQDKVRLSREWAELQGGKPQQPAPVQNVTEPADDDLPF